jgi:hypothetical protein
MEFLIHAIEQNKPDLKDDVPHTQEQDQPKGYSNSLSSFVCFLVVKFKFLLVFIMPLVGTGAADKVKPKTRQGWLSLTSHASVTTHFVIL